MDYKVVLMEDAEKDLDRFLNHATMHQCTDMSIFPLNFRENSPKYIISLFYDRNGVSEFREKEGVGV